MSSPRRVFQDIATADALRAAQICRRQTGSPIKLQKAGKLGGSSGSSSERLSPSPEVGRNRSALGQLEGLSGSGSGGSHARVQRLKRELVLRVRNAEKEQSGANYQAYRVEESPDESKSITHSQLPTSASWDRLVEKVLATR